MILSGRGRDLKVMLFSKLTSLLITMVPITIHIPEDLAQRLATQWGDLSQKSLESLAVSAYQAEVLSLSEVQRLLRLDSRWEAEDFLCQNQAYLHYDETDLAQDRQTLSRLSE